MAFTATVLRRDMMSVTEFVVGTYVSTAASTGGDIETGFTRSVACFLQPWGAAAVVANQPTVTETFSLSGGTVTIKTTANESGSFLIFGN